KGLGRVLNTGCSRYITTNRRQHAGITNMHVIGSHVGIFSHQPNVIIIFQRNSNRLFHRKDRLTYPTQRDEKNGNNNQSLHNECSPAITASSTRLASSRSGLGLYS